MSFLNKRVEESIKQAKLLAQMSEMSYRSLNGTRQTRSSFTNNDLKEQPDTDKPAVGSLTSEMIARYKREEEENNKYVDPKGKEFLYAPTGMTSTIKLSTPSLVDVASLSRPATVADVSQEKNKYAKIYQNLQDKKQELADKCGPLRTGSICAMRCTVVVRDAMRGRCTGCDARSLYCAMRCAVVVRDAMRGLVAFARCATRCALVAFARCRRHHAFDGGIFRVVITF
jgi:hypothetical protein